MTTAMASLFFYWAELTVGGEGIKIWWGGGEWANFWQIYIYTHTHTSGKGSLLAFQRVLHDSCEPEWYIQRTDEENTIYLVLRVSCYQSSAI